MKLSDEMQKCLEMAKKHNGLIRKSGGYWTGGEIKMVKDVPEWYFGTLTVKSLVKRGLLKETKFMERGDAYFVEPV
jgi:hypothetical protein